jgi:hypothetical protein
LIDGVGSALIPLLGNAHLRGKDFDEFAETHEGRPAGANVAAEAESFVLGKGEHAAQTGIDAIGESDVYDAVESAERNGRLGAIAGKRPETFALTTSEKDSKGIAHISHRGLLPKQGFNAP